MTFDEILRNLVLQNNPDLFVHAAKIEGNIIPNMVDKHIVIQLDNSKIPAGWKKSNNNQGHYYYVKTLVIAQDNFKLSKNFLTDFGWVDSRTEQPTELVPIEE